MYPVNYSDYSRPFLNPYSLLDTILLNAMQSKWLINYKKIKKKKQVCTRVDLSDKMQSATSFGSHELLSFEGKKREFGGPICMRQMMDMSEFFRVSIDVIPIKSRH